MDGLTPPALRLTRTQILAYRREVGALDRRVAHNPVSLRRAAWAGLQDSMPRAALLSIHARVEATPPTILDHPSLVQLWGPRYSVFVVADEDRAVFTLGRLPTDDRRRRRAESLADRLGSVLGDAALPFGEAGRALGEPPNRLRYAAPTGRLLLRWDGARQPIVWTVPAPEVSAEDAREELARRWLHVSGPGTSDDYAQWAGIPRRVAATTFANMSEELLCVRTPIGEGWILVDDEDVVRRKPPEAASSVRLLPSGDPYTLLHGRQRDLLVGDARRRDALWPARVWPGALLIGGEVVGTWRRAGGVVTIDAWERLADSMRDAVEAEAASLPLPDAGPVEVGWTS